MHIPLMFLSEWREFPSASCLAGNLMKTRVSMLLKSRASHDTFPFSLCNKKRLEIRHEQISLSNDNIESVLRHREVGWTKDLTALPPNVLSFYECVDFMSVKMNWCCRRQKICQILDEVLNFIGMYS